MSEQNREGGAVPLERIAGGAGSDCTFIDGNDPCSICPRRITALYMCKLLQDEMAELLE